jgi:ketosteroid isomerase-like protein
MVEAFNSADPRQAISSFHPDVEFTSGFTEHKTYLGLEGMREYAADLDAVWEKWHSEDNRFVDAGGEQVVWLYRIVGRGKGSGVPVDQAIAIVYTMRDGLIWRGRVFLDQQSALEAVGLAG